MILIVSASNKSQYPRTFFGCLLPVLGYMKNLFLLEGIILKNSKVKTPQAQKNYYTLKRITTRGKAPSINKCQRLLEQLQLFSIISCVLTRESSDHQVSAHLLANLEIQIQIEQFRKAMYASDTQQELRVTNQHTD